MEHIVYPESSATLWPIVDVALSAQSSFRTAECARRYQFVRSEEARSLTNAQAGASGCGGHLASRAISRMNFTIPPNSSGVLAISFVLFGLVQLILWLVIAWRAMRAHEEIARSLQSLLRHIRLREGEETDRELARERRGNTAPPPQP